MQIMEAVPNISEGRRTDVIMQIAAAAQNASRARVLDIDSNADANRTVITLAGGPADVRKSAFALIQAAARLIDMRLHSGAHPRLGATDVCPFVPVANMTLEEAALHARRLAKETAEKLHIPVYLYEACAAAPERKNLAFIRRGEYESLPRKLKELPPDFGPQEFSENTQKTGATVIGARNFLIAFNVSLNTKDVFPAKQIASVLREKNGGLPAVKAIGWYMPAYQCAQVSFNLTSYKTTGLAQAFEACRREAARHNLTVTGSELIGLLPEEALLAAGRFYAPALTDKTALLETAVNALGLNKIRPFNLKERILEYRLQNAV